MWRERESVKRADQKHLQAHNAVLPKLDFFELKPVTTKKNLTSLNSKKREKQLETWYVKMVLLINLYEHSFAHRNKNDDKLTEKMHKSTILLQ